MRHDRRPTWAGSKVMHADQAARLVPDGAAVVVSGAGGGLLEPDAILAAIERRFLSGEGPSGLTVLHAQGLGDGQSTGLNRLAHEGMVRRVIGSHWAWSPRMQALAAAERIEAYALPGGAIQHLVRESGAGRPGLVTPVGLDTMADPRRDGGRMNAAAVEPLNELVVLDGREYIRYLPQQVDVAIVRGSAADARGNVSFEEEGAELDVVAAAMAARNCGGRVLVQVRQLVADGSQPARRVRLPGAWVDAVVVAAGQRQSYAGTTDVELAGTQARRRGETVAAQAAPELPLERRIIGSRAVLELRPHDVVSFGFGMPDEVSRLAASLGLTCTQTVDHGHFGGESLQGALFGFVRGGEAMIDSPTQFDFYSGRGIDTAFLGFGEMDALGDVNVSRLGGRIVGPGGFIDISQGARRVVFCGTFEAKGLRVAWAQDELRILARGQQPKLVAQVDQVTFSARRALALGQEVLYVTERAVFRLTPEGVVLEEIAPGIDLEADVISRMGFRPLVAPQGPRRMRQGAPAFGALQGPG